MEKGSVLYVRKSEFARESFIKKFADSSFFEVVNVAKNIEQALEIVKKQKPSIIVTGIFFEDGTAKDLIKGIESILTFRPHIVVSTVLSLDEAHKYSYKLADRVFNDFDDEDILTKYFEHLFTSENI